MARVLITDHPWPKLDLEDRLLGDRGVQIIDAPAEDEATLAELASDVDVIATCWAQVTRHVIESAPKCKLVARMGIGLDNIDIVAANEHGMLVTNVPDYCVDEVADHTLGLILALTRNIGFFHLRTKQAEYALENGPQMHRLNTLRLGLIGFGRIGQAVYHRARGFGFEIVATSSSNNPRGTDCQMLSLDEVIETSDIVSLHVPLTDATQHLLDRVRLEKMKRGAMLVNTSRGGLIDPDALEVVLRNGHLAGAGLDVFEPEPPNLSDDLYTNERVIITPHAAFVSQEAVHDLRERVCGQILAVVAGDTPQNIVNRG